MAERVRDDDGAPRGAVPLGEQLRRLAEALVQEQQERVAAAVGVVAHGLRHAVAGLAPGERGLVGLYAEEAAAEIERLSETLRRQRLSAMMAQAEDFARRRPALFLAGAVAGGLVLGRVLADSAAESHRQSAPSTGVRAPAMEEA